MRSSAFTIIRNGLVLDIEKKTALHRDILVRDDRIAEIGQPGMTVPDGAREFDAADKLVIPGLINTHTHGHGSLGKGRGDLWTLELLLNAGPWISGKRSLDDKLLAAKLNAAELVLKGCTACYDLYFEFPTPSVEGIGAVAAGYTEVGVRSVIAPMVADISLYEAVPGLLDSLPDGLQKQARELRLDPFEKTVASNREILRNWSLNRDLARPAVAPTIPQHCSEEFLIACRDLARDFDVGVHMHLAESKIQAVTGLKLYGMSQTAYLEKLGLLSPQFVGAHCVWLDDDDISRMADHGCAITHQPGCNLRIGAGVAPVRSFLDRGITVGVGTDGSNAADSQNMFDAVRMAANVSRITDTDYKRWLSAYDTLTMATINGAKLAGLEGKAGRIAEGYLADLVFLNLASTNYIPLNNPAYQIVNCEDSSAVCDVMIGGRIVLKDREFTTFDFEKLRVDVQAAMERLNEKTEQNRDLALKLEDLVGSYCVGLAKSSFHVCRTLHC
jgi:guanine deaminase